jgi:hypothetical protein
VLVSIYRSVRDCIVDALGVGVGDGVAVRHGAGRIFMGFAPLVAVLLVLCCGVAQAEVPKLISYGHFASVTPFPLGVAVDNSGLAFSGDVYVAGVFNPSGPPVEKFGASNESLAPSPFGAEYDSGAAVNPTNGDLYVVEASNSSTHQAAVDTYDPATGKLLSSFAIPGAPNFFGLTVVGIAADSKGDVYVPIVSQNEVLEYSSSGALLGTFDGGSGAGALKQPTGVAVDAAGDVWVADTGNYRIEELNPSDSPIDEIKSATAPANSERVDSVALDGHGDVFAIFNNSEDFCGQVKSSSCSHLVEYDSAGVKVADVGADSFEAGSGGLPLPPMVAVNEADGRVYVTDASHELVWVFGPPTAPVVNRELASEVGVSEVKLGALVNPGGIETTYRFEYDTRAYREGEGPHGQSTPFPEGSAGEGVSSRTVWAAASGLAPGTTYHYRVVATNELGTVYGPDRTFTTLTAEQASCTNEQFRGGFSARLPDCRAYELVTTPVKTSVQVSGGGLAATNGDAVVFDTKEPLPGSPTGGYFYVATRGAGGWSAEDVMPLESYSSIVCPGHSTHAPAFSADLSRTLISIGDDTRASEPEGSGLEIEECNAEGVQVVPGEPVGYRNLLVRDNATGTYRLVNVAPAGVTPSDAYFKGASRDLSHVVFTEMAPLAPGALYGVEDLYEWDEGVVRLVSVLPDGTPVAGSLAEAEGEGRDGDPAISVEGSHVLFTASGGLYSRIDGERTVRVDESQVGGVPSGGGSFQAASADGSRVFFTDDRRLTADSTAEPKEPDLYECAIVEEEKAGKIVARCELSDLTVAKAGEHADVLGVAALPSKDSSHVYFTAKGVLASNTREYVDSKGSKVIEGAQDGQRNVYMWDGTKVVFIATSSENDTGGAVGNVSPDGAWLMFASYKSLTGYDNIISATGAAAEEFFLYSASSGQLACASCNPTGETPSEGGAASVGQRGLQALSDGGRLFFDTQEALVPADTNGQIDVYEYEHGQVYLVSSGTSAVASSFGGASETGGDVFFVSTQQLVPQDTEEETQVLYDARIDGGLPANVSPPACVTADACRTPVSPQPAIYGAPSSQTFSGVGNLTLIAQVKVKKKTKPKSKGSVCKRLRNKHKRAACQAKNAKRRAIKSNKRRGK